MIRNENFRKLLEAILENHSNTHFGRSLREFENLAINANIAYNDRANLTSCSLCKSPLFKILYCHINFSAYNYSNWATRFRGKKQITPRPRDGELISFVLLLKPRSQVRISILNVYQNCPSAVYVCFRLHSCDGKKTKKKVYSFL